MKPYSDTQLSDRVRIRQFEPNVDNHELVWHRDKNDRTVKVLSGEGWVFQMDEELPYEMKPGDVLCVPKETYHRLYRSGDTPLTIEITE